MLYHELVNTIKEIYEPVEIGAETGHLAVQFNVSGFGEGAFYLEIKDGKVEVMPFEYHDRDLLFFLPTEVVIALFEGKMDLELALNDGSIGYEGDREKIHILGELIRRANGGDAAIQEEWKELNGQVEEAVTEMIESSEEPQDEVAAVSETDVVNRNGAASIPEEESAEQDGGETVSEEGAAEQNGTAEQDDTVVESEVQDVSEGCSVQMQDPSESVAVETGEAAGIGSLSEELSVKQDGISSQEIQANGSANSPVQGRGTMDKRKLSSHKKKLEKRLEKKAKALIKAARKKDAKKAK